MTKRTTTVNWANFSISSASFLKAEKDQDLSQLLHDYFSKNSVANQNFVIELADKYANALLTAIRVNRAFLNPVHLASFKFLENHSNNNLKSHYLAFSKLASHENELYTEFYKLFTESKKLDTLEVFCWISIWLEEKRASLLLETKHQNSTYDINRFVETINFFLSYFLFENKNEVNKLQIKDFSDYELIAQIFKDKKAGLNIFNNTVWKTLDSAFNYLYYLKGTIEIYSFDMNYAVTVSDGKAKLVYTDFNKLKKWNIDSAKIMYWYNFYRQMATEIVNDKILENPNTIPDKSGFDYTMNHEGAIRATLANIVADDYCIDTSFLGGVPSKSLIKFLNGFVNNALGRYVLPMDELHYKIPNNWFDNILTNILNFGQHRIASSPTRLIHKSVFVKTINENISDSNNYIDQLINLVTTDISKLDYIHRLNPPVNLAGKPFIKLGEYYFAFNGVLGESNSQTNILVNVMESNRNYHQQVMSKEVESLEGKVKLLFENAGFNNSDCSIKYYVDKTPQGDFDIVVYEDGVMLLIELKRSKLRIHLSDAHDEYANSLLKASKQLDKAIEYIENNFERCKEYYFKKLNIKESDFTKIKIYPMIVSTSFENDHALIRNKHFKITLFELQNLLRNKAEHISGNKLESLIMHVFSNRYWESLERDVELPDLNSYNLEFEV